MSALQRLQEKIEQWKRDHETLKLQNSELKAQLEGSADMAATQEALQAELESKTQACSTLEENIATLQKELEEKDAEIEKIITQVEALLA